MYVIMFKNDDSHLTNGKVSTFLRDNIINWELDLFAANQEKIFIESELFKGYILEFDTNKYKDVEKWLNNTVSSKYGYLCCLDEHVERKYLDICQFLDKPFRAHQIQSGIIYDKINFIFK